MTARATTPQISGACESCLRRAWLLAKLSAALDYRCGNSERLMELLLLEDSKLIEALAGTRRATLRRSYALFQARELANAPGVERLCRHHGGYPRALGGKCAPWMLHTAGGAARLQRLAASPAVAIVGSRKASDYGMEMAKSLARGLAASGVTVISGMSDGISVAAHTGAHEVAGASIAVLGGGLDVACPSRRRSLYGRVRRHGCAVSELPCGCHGRRWGQAASERIVAGLAQVTVVVEAEQSERELTVARLALALGRTLAAVPGRVTAPASAGTLSLLMDGAHLVRGPRDVLELMHAAGSPSSIEIPTQASALDPGLAAVLGRVGAGQDTLETLLEGGSDCDGLLLAVSELELMGLLARGDGGRYVPRNSLPEPGGSDARRESAKSVNGSRGGNPPSRRDRP